MLKPNPDDADLRERIAKLNAELDEAYLMELTELVAVRDERDRLRAENARLRDKLNALSLVWDDGGRQPCSPHDPERESV